MPNDFVGVVEHLGMLHVLERQLVHLVLKLVGPLLLLFESEILLLKVVFEAVDFLLRIL